MALIGGGGKGFIGRVHLTAAMLDGEAELVAGAFSSDADKSQASASEFGVANDRAYKSYHELFEKENLLPESERIDFVSIATPNHTHADIAIKALNAGFHVVCDKPMTTQLKDAMKIVEAVRDTRRVFVLTHNYSGYPLVRQAKEMIRDGELGEVLSVRVIYQQGWMHGMKPQVEPERGAWKSDPLKNGAAGSLGDIGTHAFHLLRFITDLEPQSLLCKMKSYSDHHQLDDYGQAILQLKKDAMASITWSQVSHGSLNDLSIQVDGSKGALSWRQEEPNRLHLRRLGQPVMTYDRHPSAEYTKDSTRMACRLPAGHPEAFFEAFANLYRDAFKKIRKYKSLTQNLLEDESSLCPTVQDGLEGVLFTRLCLESDAHDSKWIDWDCDATSNKIS